jgi:hypothetical protein
MTVPCPPLFCRLPSDDLHVLPYAGRWLLPAGKMEKMVANMRKEFSDFRDSGLVEDGSLTPTDSQTTTIVEEDYFSSRHPDLAGDPSRVSDQ